MLTDPTVVPTKSLRRNEERFISALWKPRAGAWKHVTKNPMPSQSNHFCTLGIPAAMKKYKNNEVIGKMCFCCSMNLALPEPDKMLPNWDRLLIASYHFYSHHGLRALSSLYLSSLCSISIYFRNWKNSLLGYSTMLSALRCQEIISPLWNTDDHQGSTFLDFGGGVALYITLQYTVVEK